MAQSTPIVLVPGLNCSGRVYGPQMPALWRLGPVMVAQHTEGDTIAAIARNILDAAPPRFALAGISMGGYIAFEMLRQAPQRILRVAFLDTSARPDTPQETGVRLERIAATRAGGFLRGVEERYPLVVDVSRHDDDELRRLVIAMAEEVGAEAFMRHLKAVIERGDSRPTLASIACPALVLVGEGDRLIPPHLSQEIAAAIKGARLVIVPACGHLSTVERPDAVNDALVQWLAG